MVIVAIPIYVAGYKPEYLGYLGVRRNIPPIGELCFPSGYIDNQEDWKDAAAREVFEETGTTIDPDEIDLIKAVSTSKNFLALLCLAPGIPEHEVDWDYTDKETQGLLILNDRTTPELAFPVQTDYLKALYRYQYD